MKDIKFIDLSADFRILDPNIYKTNYNLKLNKLACHCTFLNDEISEL